MRIGYKIKLRGAAVILAALLPLCACASPAGDGITLFETESAGRVEVGSVDLPAEPKANESGNSGNLITLTGDTAATESGGVTVDGATVTVTAGGTYTVTGSLTGQLRVNVAEKEKVTLVLNGACITSPDSAAIFILSSPKKTVISTAADSVNILTDGEEYDEKINDERDGDVPDAALYSRDDLKLSGSGALYVQSASHRGINCKDDLEIESGDIYVVSGDDAVRGKDSITVTGGKLTLEAGGNGLRSAGKETDPDRGSITVSGGELSIVSDGDGIDAESVLTVSGGIIAAVTGGGHENGPRHSDDMFGGGSGFGGGGGFGGGPGGGGGMRPGGGRGMSATGELETVTLASGTDTDVSTKGLKSRGSVIIRGGTISLDCADDAVHSDGDILIENGSIYIESGDDAVHADNSLTVSGGVIETAASYEGLEGEIVTISGGTIRITSSDDGINAGTEGGFGGGFGGGGNGGSGGLVITGGYVVVNASGDGLDSNNTVEMSGGTVIIYGPESNGDGALDYDKSFTFTGGTMIALGSSGMAQSVSPQSGGCLAFSLSTVSGGTLLHIADSAGATVLCIENPKSYSSVVFASSTLAAGATYTVSVGGSHDGAAVDGIYGDGTYSGGEELGQINAQ